MANLALKRLTREVAICQGGSGLKYFLHLFLMHYFLQILMSVRLVITAVMRMHSALTLREVSPAIASLAILEMAQNVVWCSQLDFHLLGYWCLLLWC